MASFSWLMVTMVTLLTVRRTLQSSFDPSVCTPAKVDTTSLAPLPALGDAYSATIRWASETDRRMYDVREDYDLARGQAAVTISMPLLPKNAKMIYDLNHGYTSVFADVTKPDCTVQYPDASFHMYDNLPWLASLSDLKTRIENVRDLKYEGETIYKGVNTDHYSACLFDYNRNMTLSFNLYYIGHLSSFSVDWFLPHVPLTDRSLPYVIELYAKGIQGSKVTEYNVTGTVGTFDIDPTFADDAFFPPPGSWCDGLPMTSLPPLPSDFSLLAEIVSLDFGKVTYEHIFFNAARKMVRKDWKAVESSTTSTDLDTFTTIYDFNIGVKYRIDRHLLSCDRAAPIALGDEFTAPVQGMPPLSRDFQMGGSEVYFHRLGAFMQLLGQRLVRNVMCDVYVGYYFDNNAQRNFTVQWYFSKRRWTIETGDEIESGALMKMELWKDRSSNPIIYNIMEFRTEAPDYDAFDVSLCYSAKQKIHFVMLVKVSNPAQFSSVTHRLLKDTLIEILAKLIAEDNRFVGIQIDYDGDSNVYVYATLIERSAIDNTDIKHEQQHAMEGAFHFMEGSVRSHTDYLITNTAGQVITLTPYKLLRLNFTDDFTTPAPTSPTTTLAPPAPPKLASSTTTSTPLSTRSSSSLPTQKPYAPSQSCSCPTVQSKPLSCPTPPPCNCPINPIGTVPSVAPGQNCSCCPTPSQCNCPSTVTWSQCKQVCVRNNMCDCTQTPKPHVCAPCTTSTCDCTKDCPSKPQSNARCNQSSGKSNSDNADITIAALIGGMFGTLALGLLLGFVATRIYHLLRLQPMRRLIDEDDDPSKF